MKKVICLLLAAVMCCSLCACGEKYAQQKAEEEESLRRIEAAQNAIDYLDELNREYEYRIDFFDSLYLAENGEIHHNEWYTAYFAALDAYNALTDEEKENIQNASALTDEVYYIDAYNRKLIEQKIAFYCKDVVVEALKDTLINKSSYEEYGWIVTKSYYNDDDHSFYVKFEIEYSATNRLGGRIDSKEYASCSGNYIDGNIVITKIS